VARGEPQASITSTNAAKMSAPVRTLGLGVQAPQRRGGNLGTALGEPQQRQPGLGLLPGGVGLPVGVLGLVVPAQQALQLAEFVVRRAAPRRPEPLARRPSLTDRVRP
jgi:hypothetical protein